MASEDATTDRSGGPLSTITANPPGGSPSAPSRFALWLAGWRVAIRIARRDARRYKWRSTLIVVMVGLPVLLLTGGITLLATTDVSTAESVPRVMGSAQARISEISGGDTPRRMIQSPDGQYSDFRKDGATALTVPGFADSGGTASTVQRVTGGRVIPVLNTWIRVTLGDRRPSMPVLGIDARDPLARGMTELVSGRWANTPTEVVVTEAGIARGLPRSGTLTSTGRKGKPLQLLVVGVATGQPDNGELPCLVGLPDLVTGVSPDGSKPATFLVGRSAPVTWSDVRRLNDYGLVVQSRAVFLNPPPAAELDPQVAQTIGSSQRGNDLVLLLAVVGLFIETTLLAGPAFAVSAARQRRSLALAASNGAEARQLRRYVLGQAVVLGVVSAAVAVVAGVLLMLAGLTWWQASHADFTTGPFEVSWPRVVGVFICAVVASVLAALLPSKGIARLDIVSVLAGRTGDRSVRRGLPAAGVVVMLLSATGLIWSVAALEPGLAAQAPLMAGGSVGLVVGCLMVIPALLALVGRLGTHLTLPLRLAARDTARQRGRSTPAIAAIMAAVGALTTLSIAAASYDRHQEDNYQQQSPMGAGIIMLAGEDASERGVRSVTNRFAPQLSMEPVGLVVEASAVPAYKGKVSWVTPVPRACTEAQVLAMHGPHGGVGGVAPCESLISGDSSVQVGSLSSLEAVLPLLASQRAVLQAGGALITEPGLVRDGKVSYVAGTATQDRTGAITAAKIAQRASIPAVVADPRSLRATSRGYFGAWILPETATRLGWPVLVTSLDVTSPTGTISPAEERAVTDRLGDEYSFSVERGYQNDSWLILLILFAVAGLLVLVASLISTALSLAESQNDMATLAAVGATRHTRRGVAASQALVVAACGCLLGVGVGMIPGIASTWPLTVRTVSAVGPADIVTAPAAPVIVIPWLPLLGLVVLVPLLAAGLAWVAVRRHPQMTRRLA
ncbi:MAG: FtsX-like permease family protein [Dermatophilaceae bacterium]